MNKNKTPYFFLSKGFLIFIIGNIIFFNSNSRSQTDDSQHVSSRNKNIPSFLQTYPNHLVEGIETAFLKKNAPYVFIGGAAAIIALSQFDSDISDEFYRKPVMSQALSKAADNFGETFGCGYFAGAGLITLESLLSQNFSNEYFTKLELMLESIAVTQIITQTLKMSTQRVRPNFSDNHSFPSGHTSSTFAMAASLNGIYGWQAGIPAYLLASFVGLQRIQSKAHYLSDVLSGALLGTLVGQGFSSIHQQDKNDAPMLNTFFFFNSKAAAWQANISLKLNL